ncbi:hypothetical protein [Anaerocolumna sp.]|uniref:hypothetical protein n=1 Tax=Anaerocolumna sp. TaxID=2041569 RepID=UPI0028B23DC0|nr:hypothetical protein [Anaerocolumna sp.]
MMIYRRYKELNLDTAILGLGCSENNSNYFCTPKDANIIGWTGVDGIHFCFIHSFGEMVFTVSPMSTFGNYVHPVARDFTDFLRLLLACGDVSALEQVHRWNEAQFDTFLQDNPPTAEQRAVLDAIQEKLSLTPMDQPFAYIKDLQGKFDYSGIEYTKDCSEWMPAKPKIPEWKVWFGSFWDYHDQIEAGREISLNRQFVWYDEVWYIPAIYICSEGLVVDFCVQIPAEDIRSFMDKWNLSIENDGTGFTDEQQIQIDEENPLVININPEVILNGTVLSASHGCWVSWNPCFPEGNSPEAKSVVQHYSLGPAYGWAIQRAAFSWVNKHKTQVTTLSVTLTQEPVAMPGPHFRVSAPGEHIALAHPITGAQHTLTVVEYERQEMSHKYFANQNQEFPIHYIIMGYTLSPDLPDSVFTVTDCLHSDQPRQKNTNPNEALETGGIFCDGIIGGADGPTAIFIGTSNQGKLHTACSALHFEPADDVEWRTLFHEKTRENITLKLM